MRKELWGRYIIEVYKDDGGFDHFEAIPGAELSLCVKEVIALLRRRGKKESYTLIFNGKRLIINYASSRREIVKDYFNDDNSSLILD